MSLEVENTCPSIVEQKAREELVGYVHEKAREIRGTYLNYVSVIEAYLYEIITNYFCKDGEFRKELFSERILERMSLEQKKVIMQKIMMKNFPTQWSNRKEVFSKIERVQKIRNKLAHSTVDVSEEALSRPINLGVGFDLYENAKPIDDKTFEEMKADAVKVMIIIQEFGNLIKTLP
ncbi:hypothetical protein [Kiloniella majae]|uniref:hypothetical protein n=1 Tax=Kiloniella majae TaxID=1938558 RepID=UPI000A278F4F|nr:hypothetical protein [Kiloniella majae]